MTNKAPKHTLRDRSRVPQNFFPARANALANATSRTACNPNVAHKLGKYRQGPPNTLAFSESVLGVYVPPLYLPPTTQCQHLALSVTRYALQTSMSAPGHLSHVTGHTWRVRSRRKTHPQNFFPARATALAGLTRTTVPFSSDGHLVVRQSHCSPVAKLRRSLTSGQASCNPKCGHHRLSHDH